MNSTELMRLVLPETASRQSPENTRAEIRMSAEEIEIFAIQMNRTLSKISEIPKGGL